ncbi:thiamine transporter 1 isoform X1 [Hydra vulgaris]|uniref:thiamine transporter 1 isoform X1 n=1 Tax=Hydra vulgaris TaxID=6087 RepID=UPI001F5F5C6E|nr:thiamine transporter 1 [Hydra vulgaris]
MLPLWVKAAILTCLYGFFKELKPSAPFLTPFLNSTYKHIDIKDINDRIYPMRTYSDLTFLVVVFLSADLLRYKFFIVLESLARLTAVALLCFENGVFMMQIMQAADGIGDANEIVYYSYIYTVVDEIYFQKVTSYTRAAVLFGRGAACILGQTLLSTKATNLLVLGYISISSVSLAVIISLTLPNPLKNIFVKKLPNHSESFVSCQETEKLNEVSNIEPNQQKVVDNKKESGQLSNCFFVYDVCRLKMSTMFQEFIKSFQNKELCIWSIWWALSECGSSHVENYVMNLWAVISSDKEIYNGAVLATGTILGGLVIILFQFLKNAQLKYLGEVLISVVSIIMAAFLFVMANTTVIWVAYICHIFFRTLHVLILTISSFRVAVNVETSGYGLIFAFNTLVAKALESLLTFIIVDRKGLDLNQRTQYIVYAAYFGIIGIAFLSRPCIRLIRRISLRMSENESTTLLYE